MRTIICLLWYILTSYCCAQIDTCQWDAISYTAEGYYISKDNKERCTCVVFTNDSISGSVMIGVLLNGHRFGPWVTHRDANTITYEQRLGHLSLYATLRDDIPEEASFLIPIENRAYGHSVSSRPHTVLQCELDNGCIQVINFQDLCTDSSYRIPRFGKEYRLVPLLD